MAEESRQREVFKFFTGARRIPLMVGRLASGEKLWGGPYKVTQFVAGGIAAVIVYALYNLGIGHTGNLISDLIYGAAIVIGVIFLFGKIPMTKRNLLSMLSSIFSSVSAPSSGRYRGRPFSLPRARRRRRPTSTPKPRRVRPADLPAPVTATPTKPPEPNPVPARPIPAPTSARPMSAVDALLAQTRGH